MRRETVDDMTALSASVDFINLVSWDLAGYWSGFAGFGNALNSSIEGFTLVIGFVYVLFENCSVSKFVTREA